MSWEGTSMFPCGIGKFSLLMHVLDVGTKDAFFTNAIDGWMWNPRTGSSSEPVANFKMLHNETFPLLPPENKKIIIVFHIIIAN